MLNKSNQKSLELYVEFENEPDHKSSEESSTQAHLLAHKISSEPKHETEFKKDQPIPKKQKKFLEDLGDNNNEFHFTNEKDKKSLSKDDIQKSNKNENIKIEEDNANIPAKKKRGRPRKNKDLVENPKPKLVIHQSQSILPKNKMIKIEGTVKLDLTLFFE